MSRTRALGLVAIAAVAIAGALLVASQLGSTSSSSTSGGRQAGSRTVQRELRGIPQRGNSLGSRRAPATLLEFADLQCPFCAQYTRDALPGLLHRYVRSGRLRMEFELLSFIGPDSKRAARFAAATALQNRLWSFADVFYRQQGVENSGYVTAPFLKRLAHATPGLDGRTAFVEQSSPRARALLARARQEAGRLRVTSTPSFFLLRPDRRPRRLEVSALTTTALSQAIDSALGPPQA